jgi:uridylate kinase
MKKENIFVVSLGGSIFYQGSVDVVYLKKFATLIKSETKKGNKFIIVTGGGTLARSFQASAHNLGVRSDKDKDWLGIYATRLNAILVRALFGKIAHPDIFDGRGAIKSFGKYKVIVGCGWQPGNSTDLVAAQIAADFKTPVMINLGKPEYVYTKDNQKFKDAKALPVLTWNEYFKLVPRKWKPGMHYPIDPKAAVLMCAKNISAIVAGGRDIKNIQKILKGEGFRGTMIS